MLICTAGQAKERPRLIMVPLYSSGSKFGHVSRHSYYRARYYDPGTGRFLSEDRVHRVGESSLYTYVENSPLDFVDPSGLVARLYCEAIPSTRGGTWYNDLALFISNAYHCYLYVSCHGSGHYLELYGPGPGDPKHGRPHNDQPFNLQRANQSEIGNGYEYQLNPPPGMKCCEFEDRLDQAFNHQAANVPVYSGLGPNSNTFVSSIIQEAGGTASPPVNAYGWGWRPPKPKP